MKTLLKVFKALKSSPIAWATETTTMLGIGMIFIAIWWTKTGEMKPTDAAAMITAGVGLLFPQSAVKQALAQNALQSVLDAEAGKTANPLEPELEK